jgi:PEP-CTERM motif
MPTESSTGPGNPRSSGSGKKRAYPCLALLAATTLGGISGSKVIAVQVIVNGGYHAQVTNHWCGSASLEMMLDVPAVRGNNAVVNSLLSATDGPTVAFGDPSPVINVNHQVTFGAQSFLYGLNHGTNFAFNGPNSADYFNPSWPVGAGTDTPGVVADLNIMDSTTSPQGLGFGNDNYQGYSAAPNLTGQALASRTIANALNDYNIPAVTAVESGAHYITTYGVSTIGTPGIGNNYDINGFYIHDPWTGYAYSQASVGNFAPASASWGLGWNTYLRYGVDLDPVNGKNITLPNGNVVKGRLAPWFQIFNASPAQAGAGATFANPGVAFVVDPQGPESLDTGNLASDDSLGINLTDIPEISGSTADSDAISDLAADATLSTEPGLIGGSFDSSDEMFMPQPGDASGEGDWLVPYDGSGGINDVTGAIMIDADTGVIDEATWLDPATDGVGFIPLADLDQMFIDQSDGIYPNDNEVPEPTTLSLLLLGSAGLLARRKRKQLA